MNTYECSICQSINHSFRLHCQVCGTIPAHYSMIGVPTKIASPDNGSYQSEPTNLSNTLSAIQDSIETIVAYGCERTNSHRHTRSNMKTVSADYYADVSGE